MPDNQTARSGDDSRGRQVAKSLLGRFELIRILGKGAQSTVWLAFDPRMEREVAVKVMRPGAGVDGQAGGAMAARGPQRGSGDSP